MTELYKAINVYYPNYLPSFRKHFRKCFEKDMDFEDITQQNLNLFVAHLSDNCAKSSVKTYCNALKAVISKYDDTIQVPYKKFNKTLSVKGERCVNTFLIQDELIRLENVPTFNITEEYVKKSFLVGAYCGARLSDTRNLSLGNIIPDTNILQYVSQKTSTPTQVPLKPIVREYLKELADIPDETKNLSDVWFNTTIRSLCKRAKINAPTRVFLGGKNLQGEKWEFVSSHTARRSFATNLFLLKADIYDISRMMGHSSVTMTTGYICAQIRKLDDSTLSFFK